MARRNRLVARREELGLQQKALAHMVGVHITTVWRWEDGKTEPQSYQRRPLADAIRVPLDQLDWYLVLDGDTAAVATGPGGIDAIELIRLSEATDLGAGTLAAIRREIADRQPATGTASTTTPADTL